MGGIILRPSDVLCLRFALLALVFCPRVTCALAKPSIERGWGWGGGFEGGEGALQTHILIFLHQRPRKKNLTQKKANIMAAGAKGKYQEIKMQEEHTLQYKRASETTYTRAHISLMFGLLTEMHRPRFTFTHLSDS